MKSIIRDVLNDLSDERKARVYETYKSGADAFNRRECLKKEYCDMRAMSWVHKGTTLVESDRGGIKISSRDDEDDRGFYSWIAIDRIVQNMIDDGSYFDMLEYVLRTLDPINSVKVHDLPDAPDKNTIYVLEQKWVYLEEKWVRMG